MLFNAFENGCKAEELQLGTIVSIERARAPHLVVAWRIAYLMRMRRTCPDLDAKLFFEPGEIQAAYPLNDQLAPPESRLNDVLRMVAKAGGFLARKGDGEHGAKTIWEDCAKFAPRLIRSNRYAKWGCCRVVYNEVVLMPYCRPKSCNPVLAWRASIVSARCFWRRPTLLKSGTCQSKPASLRRLCANPVSVQPTHL